MDGMEGAEGVRLRNNQGRLKPIVTKRTGGVGFVGEDETTAVGSKEAEPLSPGARMFHEPNFNVYVIAIIGCKTPIFPQVVKANLVHTLLKHYRFCSLQVKDDGNGGQMKWVRTEVDLDNHVIVPEVDPTTLTTSPEKFIEDYIFDLSKTSIPYSKPLWDIHLLNLKTSDAESVCILRVHHSVGDGTSLISLLLACTRKTSDPAALPTVPVKKAKEKVPTSGAGSGSGSYEYCWSQFLTVWWVLRMLWNTVVDVVMFAATAWFLKDTETPLKGPPGIEFTPRRFVHRTTINDVALGVAQAGLSKYLNRKYGQGKEEKAMEKKNNLLEKIRLRSTLLINLRPTGMQALADMMEKESEAKWGNWIGFVVLPFTIGLRDDPLDYVREAKATIDRKKHSFEALFTFYLSDIFLKLFGIKSAGALSHRIIEHTTMCFSNLVGPLEDISFYGHPIAYLAPSSYGQPHALMMNFQSYVNKMSIVLSVDEGTIPDAHQLCEDLVESLNLIKHAVVSRGLVKAT
ncbi:wax ester synthase/diacylglycerol acyltransferase 11-like isoform X2 [Malania oleifera]|uniref:wax ester synthase/diacylglycerol acyltransferase 11-like isoform X2 n=1 Tax=Malania oleifera TaxID=397392 RepID=UPI0025AE7923|nr:wax ester synthase/diacylglycerol acyltransferase 11-like isoform X2 [Malania oleifera]